MGCYRSRAAAVVFPSENFPTPIHDLTATVTTIHTMLFSKLIALIPLAALVYAAPAPLIEGDIIPHARSWSFPSLMGRRDLSLGVNGVGVAVSDVNHDLLLDIAEEELDAIKEIDLEMMRRSLEARKEQV